VFRDLETTALARNRLALNVYKTMFATSGNTVADRVFGTIVSTSARPGAIGPLPRRSSSNMPGMSFRLVPCISESCDDEMSVRIACSGAAGPNAWALLPGPQSGLHCRHLSIGQA
jgi:hypothetical protein